MDRRATALLLVLVPGLVRAQTVIGPENVVEWDPYPDSVGVCVGGGGATGTPVGVRLYYRLIATVGVEVPMADVPVDHPPICCDGSGMPIETPRVALAPVRYGDFTAGTNVVLSVRGYNADGESCGSNEVTVTWPPVCAFTTRDELLASMGVAARDKPALAPGAMHELPG